MSARNSVNDRPTMLLQNISQENPYEIQRWDFSDEIPLLNFSDDHPYISNERSYISNERTPVIIDSPLVWLLSDEIPIVDELTVAVARRCPTDRIVQVSSSAIITEASNTPDDSSSSGSSSNSRHSCLERFNRVKNYVYFHAMKFALDIKIWYLYIKIWYLYLKLTYDPNNYGLIGEFMKTIGRYDILRIKCMRNYDDDVDE